MSRISIVIGASGGIGTACVQHLTRGDEVVATFAVSRSPMVQKHLFSERDNDRLTLLQADSSRSSMQSVVEEVKSYVRSTPAFAQGAPSYEIIIATGLLHRGTLQPEKRIDTLNKEDAMSVLETNTVMPMLWLQALSQLFSKQVEARVVVLSARVGSIGDNQLGGWYSYRASKAALNMMLKTSAVEFARRFPKVKLIAYHPGTTQSALSEPFSGNVPKGKLFSPDYSAERLLSVMREQPIDRNLSFVAWDGQQIDW